MSKWRFGCGDKINVVIRRGWDYVTREVECGSTAHDGGVNQCPACFRRHEVDSPREDESDMDWFERVSEDT